jgi:hypothetical protein
MDGEKVMPIFNWNSRTPVVDPWRGDLYQDDVHFGNLTSREVLLALNQEPSFNQEQAFNQDAVQEPSGCGNVLEGKDLVVCDFVAAWDCLVVEDVCGQLLFLPHQYYHTIDSSTTNSHISSNPIPSRF